MILNGNMMLKTKKSRKVMKILRKNLWLKIFLKWINKSFWITKILKPKTNQFNLNPKEINNRMNKKFRIKC